MKRNPRPRKYESAAARQAAYKARAEVLEFRAEPKTAASLTSIAQELDVSRSELLLSMVKFALTNHDWARFGLTHKTLPYYQGNPIMIPKLKRHVGSYAVVEIKSEKIVTELFKDSKLLDKINFDKYKLVPMDQWLAGLSHKENPIMAIKKASPAQLAARKKFAEMARSGAFKKAKRAADRDKNPAKMTRHKAAKKTVSQKISQLVHEGYPQKQAVAVALSEKRAGKVKSNPMGKSIAGQHLFNLGSNYFAAVTLTGYNDYYAQIFYKTTDPSGFTNEQIVPDYKPRHFSTAKAAINSVMKYATKNKLKSNPIAEMREFTVMKWKRGKNTTNGNPVYEFILKDEFGGMHTGKTKPNAGWVYGISSVYEGDKINAALEETKGGRVYMVDYGKRKSNPHKRSSSRSAVVPNPSKKRTYTVFCQVDGQGINNWTKLATFYSATKATQYAKAYAKQYPKHYVRVESHG